ncbi:hypothetical protein [Polaromonas sp. CG9_12]|uniref:hypothetical protein n=1 Tax=Polaromonas sp. CG_9.11 TaxID=2787730 RepID=UPI0004DDDB6C|nr:hypothetical protein [Polaromonas sp. CG_9.11]MBG6076373.1 hypothetical protein [Polaromonas sp. CG_9.11]CDS50516.1 hypothetical protein [Polaromonas sp. CG9_12]
MLKLNSRLLAGAALSAALLAGCGGNSDDHGAGGGGSAGQTITDVVAYINGLIAGNGENTDPIDINPLTLAVDDNADPAPLQ